jgi:hypothetical protein
MKNSITHAARDRRRLTCCSVAMRVVPVAATLVANAVDARAAAGPSLMAFATTESAGCSDATKPESGFRCRSCRPVSSLHTVIPAATVVTTVESTESATSRMSPENGLMYAHCALRPAARANKVWNCAFGWRCQMPALEQRD